MTDEETNIETLRDDYRDASMAGTSQDPAEAHADRAEAYAEVAEDAIEYAAQLEDKVERLRQERNDAVSHKYDEAERAKQAEAERDEALEALDRVHTHLLRVEDELENLPDSVEIEVWKAIQDAEQALASADTDQEDE